METRLTCPLGSKCEEAKDGYIERCSWFIEMRGKDATGKEHDTWRCAIAWQPILQIEMAGTTRNVAASVQSMRNEQTKTQRQALQVMQTAIIEEKQREIEAKNDK